MARTDFSHRRVWGDLVRDTVQEGLLTRFRLIADPSYDGATAFRCAVSELPSIDADLSLGDLVFGENAEQVEEADEEGALHRL